MENLVYILAALNQFYRSAHWRSKGELFYQDHLLFQRLYEKIDDEIDGLVESIIGTTGDDSFVSPQLFNQKTALFIPIGRDTREENLIPALKLENELLARISMLKENEVSVGLFNRIAGIADSHTSNLYLIKQALK